MLYYHLLTKEEAEEALKLPAHVFHQEFKRPEGCGYESALDRRFGCPYLFRSERDRSTISRRCPLCACGKGYR